MVLAIEYGANKYTTKEELLEADLIDLIARVIYGEQTKTKDKGQEAVAWTIANRVLAQDKSNYSLNNGPSNLFNIVARPMQYTCLNKEGTNDQSFTKKAANDIGWDGWLNAVTLSAQMVTFFDENYVEGVSLPKEEIDKLRQQLESEMCPSPIGDMCLYRATGTFKDHYDTDAEGRHYFDGVEIYPPIPANGNTFFQYK